MDARELTLVLNPTRIQVKIKKISYRYRYRIDLKIWLTKNFKNLVMNLMRTAWMNFKKVMVLLVLKIRF